MRTAPSTKRASNLDVKQAAIALMRPTPKTLECSQYHTNTQRVDQVPARATGSAQRPECDAGSSKLRSCQDVTKRRCANSFQPIGHYPRKSDGTPLQVVPR
eukprot:874358-Ditylum_brightwellii.AAC.1